MMIATVTAEQLTLAFYEMLIARLEDQARWREAKAEEWPEDHRNKNSAEALWTAAQILRQFDPDELPAVRSFVEFAQVLERNDLSAEPWSLVGGWFVGGRFHFDNRRRDVTYVDAVDCLNDMFRQSAKDYGDALDIADVTPELRAYFEAHGVPLQAGAET